ncbi:MAG: hypothetical protein ABI852_07585 [Gemmatimonadaceae bacterium]
MIAMSPEAPKHTSLIALHERLLELSEPLAEAFDSRLRAIDSTVDVDCERNGTEPLLSALLACLPHANNIVELLPLASEVALLSGNTPSALSIHRHAVQALDWSIRDLLLEQYTADERIAFNECTGLFIELLRRTGTSSNEEREGSPTAATLS